MMHTGEARSENWLRLVERLDSGEWIHFPMAWERAAARAAELLDKFGAPFKGGTLDSLHIKVMAAESREYKDYDLILPS